jgi:hypothetical protein
MVIALAQLGHVVVTEDPGRADRRDVLAHRAQARHSMMPASRKRQGLRKPEAFNFLGCPKLTLGARHLVASHSHRTVAFIVFRAGCATAANCCLPSVAPLAGVCEDKSLKSLVGRTFVRVKKSAF